MAGLRILPSAALFLTWVSLIHACPQPTAPSESAPHSSRAISARADAADYKNALALADMKGLTWTGDLAKALAQAAENKKLVFLEFTAATNINGVYNHRAVFTKPAVKTALGPYVLVMLFVDAVPEAFFAQTAPGEKRFTEGEANNQFEKDAFVTAAMPLCVILKPLGEGKFEVVGRYDEGRIKNEEKFVEFLRGPFTSDK